MGGRHATPGVVLIDDVVMNQSPVVVDFDGSGWIERLFFRAAEEAAAPDQEGRPQPLAAMNRVGADRLGKIIRPDGERKFILLQKLIDVFGNFSELVDHGSPLSCSRFRTQWLP